MKKIILAAFAVSALLPTVAFAAPKPDSNGATKSCFGQGRSDYASDPTNPKVGPIISERAQQPGTDGTSPNQNVQQNKEYKEACQAAGAPL